MSYAARGAGASVAGAGARAGVAGAIVRENGLVANFIVYEGEMLKSRKTVEAMSKLTRETYWLW